MKVSALILAFAGLTTSSVCAQESSAVADGKMAECKAILIKIGQNLVLTDDEIKKLTGCKVDAPVCGGAICEAVVPKHPSFQGIGTNWNDLFAG